MTTYKIEKTSFDKITVNTTISYCGTLFVVDYVNYDKMKISAISRIDGRRIYFVDGRDLNKVIY